MNTAKKKKIDTGVKFLIFVLAGYALVAGLNFPLAKEAFLGFLEMFAKIIPVLVLVFAVMVLVNVYFTRERTGKYLGAGSGLRGWLYAIVSGILVSGPPYILFPLLGDLKRHGMKNSLLAVFLYNRNIKIPFIPAMIYYFGLDFTIILSVYIIIFSILNGLLLGWQTQNKF